MPLSPNHFSCSPLNSQVPFIRHLSTSQAWEEPLDASLLQYCAGMFPLPGCHKNATPRLPREVLLTLQTLELAICLQRCRHPRQNWVLPFLTVLCALASRVRRRHIMAMLPWYSSNSKCFLSIQAGIRLHLTELHLDAC